MLKVTKSLSFGGSHVLAQWVARLKFWALRLLPYLLYHDALTKIQGGYTKLWYQWLYVSRIRSEIDVGTRPILLFGIKSHKNPNNKIRYISFAIYILQLSVPLYRYLSLISR